MYPKICTSRKDHTSKVVVANAEQEAELPEEYQDVRAGQVGEASDVLLSPAYDELLAAREQLEKDRADFAAHMAEQEKSLSDRRDELTAGYRASVEDLKAGSAALDADIAEWNKAKEGGQPDEPPADEQQEADKPAKRTRVAKE